MADNSSVTGSPDQESNRDPLLPRAALQPLSSPGQQCVSHLGAGQVGGSGCHRLRLGRAGALPTPGDPVGEIGAGSPCELGRLVGERGFRAGAVSNPRPHVQLPGDCATSSEAEVQGLGENQRWGNEETGAGTRAGPGPWARAPRGAERSRGTPSRGPPLPGMRVRGCWCAVSLGRRGSGVRLTAVLIWGYLLSRVRTGEAGGPCPGSGREDGTSLSPGWWEPSEVRSQSCWLPAPL